ncbi:exopolysaccharide biosynthesis protein [Rhizobiales bacterium RZME27]|uniref:Exopolysaccharide biosynthesis protein n=1 Tax=Endobacterium cereale TaxID=2663029 RepID=A0A6A8A528_9HYPH|nr:sugar transferase [Endobacterium cereale]MEB2848154.1 sugar transferase [Endobacterium cereale]MQY46143.1 exopolysaccharide biosynthesis protein [Endobacterium cereale]
MSSATIDPPFERTEFSVKRVIDLTISAIAVAALLPLLILLYIAVKQTTPGPALFVQARYGLGGVPFNCFKYRTMYVAREPSIFTQCARDDPRVTPLGKILRATSLDELPQLFNVLLGSMSLVGPRPHPLKLDDDFAAQIHDYRDRFRVKPGITGLAQIMGNRGETSSLGDMERRIEADRSYVKNQSLALDLGILCATIPCVIKGTNAF